MAVFLAFDSSVGPCSVAVWQDGKIAAYQVETQQVMQAQKLVPMIEEALVQAGVDYSGVQGIATTLGPGSFTGIRVGLATARAFHLASGIPLFGATTLEVLAYGAFEEACATGYKTILSVLNAGRGQIYAQFFRIGAQDVIAVSDAAMTDPARLASSFPGPALIVGTMGERMRAWIKEHDMAAEISQDHVFPDARPLARLASLRAAMPLHAMRPLYIRPPDAKLPAAV